LGGRDARHAEPSITGKLAERFGAFLVLYGAAAPQDTALTDKGVALIVKHYAQLAGLDLALFAGHSLRAGYVTNAVETNAPLMKIVEQTRHKSVEMVRLYSRRVDLFRNHSGAGFL